MTTRLSGHFSIFSLVFFVFKSLLGIARQWSRKKFAILTLTRRSHARFLVYATSTSLIMHLICPPKFCITFIFHFFWALQPSQEKLKNNAYAKFLGANKVHYGNVEMAYIERGHLPDTFRFQFPSLFLSGL